MKGYVVWSLKAAEIPSQSTNYNLVWAGYKSLKFAKQFVMLVPNM